MEIDKFNAILWSILKTDTFIQRFFTFKTQRTFHEGTTHPFTVLSVLPKDTTAAFICRSWNRTANLWASGSERSTTDVYVESEIRTANLQIRAKQHNKQTPDPTRKVT
ncbi:hypothetical protein NQD34_012343 [Periophthalmus magnuspinnatus]|nr:hypothetical protein NQD34_012343 [Periophthalmus magnuspinnatus]